MSSHKKKYSNFETCFTIIIMKTNPVFGFVIISLWDTYLLLSVVHSFGAFIFRHRMRSSSEALHHKRFGRNLYVSHNFIFRHWPPRTYYYPSHVCRNFCLKLLYLSMSGYSLLDKAPIYLVGCVNQKRKIDFVGNYSRLEWNA